MKMNTTAAGPREEMEVLEVEAVEMVAAREIQMNQQGKDNYFNLSSKLIYHSKFFKTVI